MRKRKLEVVVLSDIHLGADDCHVQELLGYLNSIDPKKLILNGDIFDASPTKDSTFSDLEQQVIRKIDGLASRGTEVCYITGNRDTVIGKLYNPCFGHFPTYHKLILDLDGKKAFIFHGDILDRWPPYAKWMVKLGTLGYEGILTLNAVRNWLGMSTCIESYMISKKANERPVHSPQHIIDFEQTMANFAIKNNFDYVVCGHLHLPKKEVHETDSGRCTYLNSGDWVNHLTALEYSFKRWKIYHYQKDKLSPFFADAELKKMSIQDLIAATVPEQEQKSSLT